jgi:hypothetical protein
LRASESPIAIACLRLFTFFPDLPDFNSPRFISCIARPTFCEAFLPYFLPVDFLGIDVTSIKFQQRTKFGIRAWFNREQAVCREKSASFTANLVKGNENSARFSEIARDSYTRAFSPTERVRI